MTKKHKAQTVTQRVRASNQRKKDAGLKQIKIWVHPDDVIAVRNYVDKKPMTKAINQALGLM